MSEIYLTDKQYFQIMNNLEFEIKRGLKLSGFDDNTPGDKSIQCTWGLCGDNPRVQSEANMHLFPKELPGRLSPKYRKEHHRCPFEDPTGKDQQSGCFYRCRFFLGKQNPSKQVWLQWKKEALRWSENEKS